MRCRCRAPCNGRRVRARKTRRARRVSPLAETAVNAPASLDPRCAQLQHDVDSLALFARTLLTMLEDSKVVTRAQPDATKNRLDMLDGKLDDRGPRVDHGTGRELSRRKSKAASKVLSPSMINVLLRAPRGGRRINKSIDIPSRPKGAFCPRNEPPPPIAAHRAPYRPLGPRSPRIEVSCSSPSSSDGWRASWACCSPRVESAVGRAAASSRASRGSLGESSTR